MDWPIYVPSLPCHAPPSVVLPPPPPLSGLSVDLVGPLHPAQHALPWGPIFVKDLSRMGRDLDRTSSDVSGGWWWKTRGDVEDAVSVGREQGQGCAD